MRSKSFKLANNNIKTVVGKRYRSRGYLIWRGLERDPRKFGYFFSNFHIETFLGIESLEIG